MKNPVPVGTSAELTTIVQMGANTIALGSNPKQNQQSQAVVYSTPSMINLMELAARKALVPFLHPD